MEESLVEKKPVKNYVDKQALFDNIVNWQDEVSEAKLAGIDPPIMPDSIGSAIMNIAYGLGSRYNFSGYSWRDEMVLDGILAATRAIPLFDRNNEKKNPFGFLTFVVWRAMVGRLKKENAEHAAKMSMLMDETILGYDTIDGEEDHGVSKANMIGVYSLND